MKKLLFISFLFVSLWSSAQVVTRPLLYSKIDSLGLAKADTSHTHVPGDILTDATHRFVTDLQINVWSLKLGTADTLNISARIDLKVDSTRFLDSVGAIKQALADSVAGVKASGPLDPAWIGVLDDSTIDQTVLLQAAVNTRRSVNLNGRTYKVSHLDITICPEFYNGRLIGSDSTQSVLYAKRKNGGQIHDISIKAVNSKISIGVQIDSSRLVYIHKVTVTDFGTSGIRFNSDTSSYLGYNKFYNAASNYLFGSSSAADIDVQGSSQNCVSEYNNHQSGGAYAQQFRTNINGDHNDGHTVANNYADGYNSYGFLFYRNAQTLADVPFQSVAHCKIYGNTIKNISGARPSDPDFPAVLIFGDGIYLQGAEFATVTGNHIDSTCTATNNELLAPGGIGFANVGNGTVSDNIITHSFKHGIFLNNTLKYGDTTGKIIIQANTLKGGLGSAFRAHLQSSVAFNGNGISDFSGNGVYVDNASGDIRSNYVVNNNLISKVGFAGLNFAYASSVSGGDNIIDTAGTHGVSASNCVVIDFNHNTVKNAAVRGFDIAANNSGTLKLEANHVASSTTGYLLNAYAVGSGNTNFNNGTDFSGTYAGQVSFAGPASYTVNGSVTAKDSLTSTGQRWMDILNASGSYSFRINGTQLLLLLNNSLTAYQNFLPAGNNSLTLGSSTQQWRKLWISDSLFVKTKPVGSADSVVVKTVNGTLGAMPISSLGSGELDTNRIAFKDKKDTFTISQVFNDTVFVKTRTALPTDSFVVKSNGALGAVPASTFLKPVSSSTAILRKQSDDLQKIVVPGNDPSSNNDLVFDDFNGASLGPSWTDATPSATVSVSGGYLNLSGGSSSDKISHSFTTITHRWTYETRLKIGSVGGSDYFIVGLESTSGGPIRAQIKLSDLSGYWVYNSTDMGTTPAQGTTSIGDIVIMRVTRSDFDFTYEIENVTKATSKKSTFRFSDINGTSSTVYPFRDFNIFLRPFAGLIAVDYAKLTNNQRIGADYMFVGHSIAEGFDAGPADSTFYSRLERKFPHLRFALHARSGTTASDFLTTYKNQIIYQQPRNVILLLGINEVQNSVSQATFIANLSSLVDTLEKYQITVKVCNMTPWNNANKTTVASFNTAINSTFGTQVINIYDTLESNGLLQGTTDSLHPNAIGHRYVYQVLRDSIYNWSNPDAVKYPLITETALNGKVDTATANARFNSKQDTSSAFQINPLAPSGSLYIDENGRLTTKEVLIVADAGVVNFRLGGITSNDINLSRNPGQLVILNGDGSQYGDILGRNIRLAGLGAGILNTDASGNVSISPSNYINTNDSARVAFMDKINTFTKKQVFGDTLTLNYTPPGNSTTDSLLMVSADNTVKAIGANTYLKPGDSVSLSNRIGAKLDSSYRLKYDTLTLTRRNDTLTLADTLLAGLEPSSRNYIKGWWLPYTNSTAVNNAVLGNTNPVTLVARTIVASSTGADTLTSFPRAALVTASTGSSIAQSYTPQNVVYPAIGFTYVVAFGNTSAATVANQQMFNGMYTGTGTLAGNSNPSSTLTSCFGIGKDNTDNNWQFMCNDGSGTCTKVDLGANFPATTLGVDWYEATFYIAKGGTTVSYSVRRMNVPSQALSKGIATTNIPTSTTLLSDRSYVGNGTTALAASMDLFYKYIYIKKP